MKKQQATKTKYFPLIIGHFPFNFKLPGSTHPFYPFAHNPISVNEINLFLKYSVFIKLFYFTNSKNKIYLIINVSSTQEISDLFRK